MELQVSHRPLTPPINKSPFTNKLPPVPLGQHTEFKPQAPVSVDLSNNQQFDPSEAGKDFAKGFVLAFISQFTSAQRLAWFAGAVSAATLAMAIFPPVEGLLGAIGIAFGFNELRKFGLDLYRAKNGDEAEKAFEHLGAGIGNLAPTILGCTIARNTIVAEQAAAQATSARGLVSIAKNSALATPNSLTDLLADKSIGLNKYRERYRINNTGRRWA